LLGDRKWDVIHFNWGLHDLKHMGPDGSDFADPAAAGSRRQVPLEDYERNLRELVSRLEQTGARLVWCATTPVPAGARGRLVADPPAYNQVAAKVMRDRGIPVNDLYASAITRLDRIQKPADVHFTADGSQVLARVVAAHLQAALSTDRPDGFRPMFDGQGLNGWFNVNCAPETWSYSGGMLHCTGVPIGELRTTQMYQNFVLELEWRHLQPQGNAGVFVWADDITARGQPFHRGIEVQVLDGREGEWFTSDGDIFPIHGATMVPDNGRRGGSRAFPIEKRANPSPQWNHYRVVAIDGAIQLAVNGKVVTSGSQCNPRKGYICLESEGSPVDFRNVRIRPLIDTPMDPDQVARADRGFVSLYNGVDLRGWKTHDGLVGHWQPKDWTLAYDGQATGESKDLWTHATFRDFELIVDWRWPAAATKTLNRPVILPTGDYELNSDGSPKEIDTPVADSGIYLRGSTKAQINIWQWPIGSGEVWGYRTDTSMPAEIRQAVTPKSNADKPVGEWNRFEITMRGEHLTVILNGTTVIQQARLPNVPAEGSIGLRHHGDPIEFANIYVRKLE
jgi:hypothetical protein